MLFRRLAAPVGLAFILLEPMGIFAQRSSLPPAFHSTSTAGSTYRAYIMPVPVQSGIPTHSVFPANDFPRAGLESGNGFSIPPSPTIYLPSQGVFRPMAGAGDSDASVRENTPEDEALLRAYGARSGSPTLPVYQPRSGTSLVSTTATALPATVVVRVPPDAQVWFDDSTTRSTGSERSFETPALTAGKTYRYEVKAHWIKDGKPVDVSRRIDVRSGESSVVDFLAPTP